MANSINEFIKLRPTFQTIRYLFLEVSSCIRRRFLCLELTGYQPCIQDNISITVAMTIATLYLKIMAHLFSHSALSSMSCIVFGRNTSCILASHITKNVLEFKETIHKNCNVWHSCKANPCLY